MYYIGIDLGTSAIKLLLMEGNGKICNIVSKEYPLSFPNPGWSEQNPYDWYDQMIEGTCKRLRHNKGCRNQLWRTDARPCYS